MLPPLPLDDVEPPRVLDMGKSAPPGVQVSHRRRAYSPAWLLLTANVAQPLLNLRDCLGCEGFLRFAGCLSVSRGPSRAQDVSVSFTLCWRRHAVQQIAEFGLGEHCGPSRLQEIVIVRVGV